MAWGDYSSKTGIKVLKVLIMKKKVLIKSAFGFKTKSFNVKKEINLYAFKLKSINKVKSRK